MSIVVWDPCILIIVRFMDAQACPLILNICLVILLFGVIKLVNLDMKTNYSIFTDYKFNRDEILVRILQYLLLQYSA